MSWSARPGRAMVVAVSTLALGIGGLASAGASAPDFRPGSPGIGDPYFPRDGNGGYDVAHYDLRVRYRPATDRLDGVATLTARATQPLSRFDLDLDRLRVSAVRVAGRPARWTREGSELVVTPARGLRRGERFTVRVTYGGRPGPSSASAFAGGFLSTDDGAVVAGQPQSAATWYPVNDHPSDTASYTFRVTVPRGRSVVANGDLVGRTGTGAWRTWTWRAVEPMASYLTTIDIGRWRSRDYRRDGIRFHDAIDPDLFTPVGGPSTGTRFAWSGQANASYKRLVRTVDVPAGGASVELDVTRSTEPQWDYLFVEAHTPGQDDWTTLRDLNGHTSQDTGESCRIWPEEQPFITAHYQSVTAGGVCSPSGPTGEWWAASGEGDGTERWKVDLGAWAGRSVELAVAYVSDGSVQGPGVSVDDIVVSTGQGSTSFESGLDGWAVPGPPAGSAPNENDWTVATSADLPPTPGDIAAGSLARQPEVVRFLSGVFGPYPFRSAGGIVDDVEGLGFALETQTRPVYARDFFTDSVSGDSVVVHELAHQWYGDSLTVRRWRNIWLNEGFATYAEWLWSEHEGLATAQEQADFFWSVFEADSPFWQLNIGDPGPQQLFDAPVYYRGALAVHALRLKVGDRAFFRILRGWPQQHAGQSVTIGEFRRFAERVSGQDLRRLFAVYLFSPKRPPLPAPAGAEPPAASASSLAPQLVHGGSALKAGRR